MYNNLISEEIPIQLIGIGKNSNINGLSNWTDGNNSSVCADESPFQIWSDWNASQRDLFMIDIDGNLILHQNISSGIPDNLEDLIYTTLENEVSHSIANNFRLYQNFPNPFNPNTSISYTILEQSYVRMTIYNLKGDVIRNLINEKQNAGDNTIIWNATNNQGRPVSAGVYFYIFESVGVCEKKKMILLK